MKTIINILVTMSTLVGIMFILGCGDDPVIALFGAAFLAPGIAWAKVYGDYLQRKEDERYDSR